MKNKPELKTIIVPYFGAPRAALFSYATPFLYQLSTSLCTHFHSGNRPSKGEGSQARSVRAFINAENGISMPNARYIKESKHGGSKKKAQRAYRALFSHYLYVSPYWA